MPRRLLLLALDYARPKDPPLSLGQASILANLLHRQVDVHPRSWSVTQPGFNPHEVTQFIMERSAPETDVALGAYVWNEHVVQSVTESLRRYKFPGRIILGGPQISYVKRGLEQLYPADIFVRGYAEQVLANLFASKDPMPLLKGIHYAGTPDLGLSANAPLETLPSPFLEGHIPAQPFIRWETQRGCPFRCSFCQHREPDKTFTQRRFFAPERVQQETRWLKANPIIQDVAVLDPTFNSGPNYLNVLHWLEGYTGKLALQVRIEMITSEFLDAIEKVNKTGRVVLELGLQTIHKQEYASIERPNNMKKVDEILDELKRRHIECEISLIFGLPHQTYESFEKSVTYCMDKGIPTIHAFPLMLLRGTPLHDEKAKFGLVESHEIASVHIPRQQNHIPHVVSSPSFSYADWRKMAELAQRLETEYNVTKKPL